MVTFCQNEIHRTTQEVNRIIVGLHQRYLTGQIYILLDEWTVCAFIVDTNAIRSILLYIFRKSIKCHLKHLRVKGWKNFFKFIGI